MLKGKNKCKRQKFRDKGCVRSIYWWTSFSGGGLNLFFRPRNWLLGYCIQWGFEDLSCHAAHMELSEILKTLVMVFALSICYLSTRNGPLQILGIFVIYHRTSEQSCGPPPFLSLKYVQRFSDHPDHYLKHTTQNTSIITILLVLIRKYKRHFHDSNHYIHLKHL